MNRWISIKEKTPIHKDTILAYSKKGQCVVVFIDSKIMNYELSMTPYAHEAVDIKDHPYYFVSQEVKRHTLNGVTHWMPLPEPPC